MSFNGVHFTCDACQKHQRGRPYGQPPRGWITVSIDGGEYPRYDHSCTRCKELNQKRSDRAKVRATLRRR